MLQDRQVRDGRPRHSGQRTVRKGLTPGPADIIPFPAARRAKLIRDVAAQMARRSIAEAEKHLHAQLDTQRRALRRRGIANQRIEREMRSLERAIRVALWSAILLREDGD